MNDFNAIVGIISFLTLVAFIVLCINVGAILKNQKKIVYLLGKMHEASGGKLTDNDRLFLNK